MARMAIDIRSVLIPVTGNRVLLPNATVAEVITFSTPDALEDTPDWVLGRVVWRGWRVPVFSLPMLAGWSPKENEAGAKIAVLKALGGNPDMPFMAMVTQGFPRLVTVTADSLEILNGDPGAQESTGTEPAGEDLDDSVETPAASETGDYPDDEPDLEDFTVEMEYSDFGGDDSGEFAIDLGDEGEEADPAPEPEAEAAHEAEAAPETETPSPGNGSADGFDPTAAVVRVAGERAVIPDLVPIERRVAEAIGPDALKHSKR